jgi:2-C-methyl-D-erythritol 2,4-cyclodiphosphate synthase
VRVGFGYDVHPLVEGRPLVLAGVVVPFGRGLDGYSDGDVVAHALIDALLGAAALGDCGTHFPAGDPRFNGADSVDLVRQAVSLVKAKRFDVGNVDCTIVAEQPALAPFVAHMRANLAVALGLHIDLVSVKAKRTEGLGFEGEGRGITAFAIASIIDSGTASRAEAPA